jgi:hypothetical protein
MKEKQMIKLPYFANPANLEVKEDEPKKVEEGPEGETSLQLLQNVYRDRKQPLNVRVRCAVESLVHEYPKLSAVAHGSFDGRTYADALEAALRAIERSKQPLPLPAAGKTVEHDGSELKGAFARLERRF